MDLQKRIAKIERQLKCLNCNTSNESDECCFKIVLGIGFLGGGGGSIKVFVPFDGIIETPIEEETTYCFPKDRQFNITIQSSFQDIDLEITASDGSVDVSTLSLIEAEDFGYTRIIDVNGYIATLDGTISFSPGIGLNTLCGATLKFSI
jgi:hypothetical protein